MREGGGDDLIALLALASQGMVSADNGSIGEDGICAAAGLEAEKIHTGNLIQDLSEIIDDLKQALQRIFVQKRVEFRHFG